MIEINNLTKYKINIKSYIKKFEFVLKLLELSDKYISIAFVDSKEMKRVNLNYRGKNKPTDVLSFPNVFIDKKWNYKKFKEQDLGEIVFCYDVIKKQAKEHKKTIENETIFMFVHGVLHLLGYEDEKTEKEYLEMEKEQQEIMKKIS